MRPRSDADRTNGLSHSRSAAELFFTVPCICIRTTGFAPAALYLFVHSQIVTLSRLVATSNLIAMLAGKLLQCLPNTLTSFFIHQTGLKGLQKGKICASNMGRREWHHSRKSEIPWETSDTILDTILFNFLFNFLTLESYELQLSDLKDRNNRIMIL